jgi:hypothetical protein
MKGEIVEFSYEVELGPDDKLTLPLSLTEHLKPGRWLITFQPLATGAYRIRDHSAFLNGYAPEDEGLYDDPTG